MPDTWAARYGAKWSSQLEGRAGSAGPLAGPVAQVVGSGLVVAEDDAVRRMQEQWHGQTGCGNRRWSWRRYAVQGGGIVAAAHHLKHHAAGHREGLWFVGNVDPSSVGGADLEAPTVSGRQKSQQVRVAVHAGPVAGVMRRGIPDNS